MRIEDCLSKLHEWGIKFQRVQVVGDAYNKVSIPKNVQTGLKKLRVLDFLKCMGFYIMREV